jgi:hypothetical protein
MLIGSGEGFAFNDFSAGFLPVNLPPARPFLLLLHLLSITFSTLHGLAANIASPPFSHHPAASSYLSAVFCGGVFAYGVSGSFQDPHLYTHQTASPEALF